MNKSTATAAVVTLGIDLAKTIFQLHGVDAAGKVVIQRAVKRKDFIAVLSRLPQCLIGMEACATALCDVVRDVWDDNTSETGHSAYRGSGIQ